MRIRLLLLIFLFCAAFALGRYSIEYASLHPPAKAPLATSTITQPSPDPGPLFRWLGLQASDDDNADTTIDPVASYEDLMYAQPDLVDASLKRLRAQTPGKIDLYALGFAGDAGENVFRNEVDYLPKLLSQRFGAEGRTMQLINSPQTFDKTPLATRTNLYDALHGIAAKMDRNNDILLLFLTSHGSHDHELYVEMGSMPLDQLTPEDIRDAMDAAHIRWRVVVISACYSGGFIPALREPHTLVITAARSDRSSFGCGSDSQITWFGKAFLADALNQTTDFRDAYARAAKTIASWEQRDHETPSQPQISEGSLMQQHLDLWRATLNPGAPVAFEPAAPPAANQRARR